VQRDRSLGQNSLRELLVPRTHENVLYVPFTNQEWWGIHDGYKNNVRIRDMAWAYGTKEHVIRKILKRILPEGTQFLGE